MQRRRIATAALLLCVVIATMLITFRYTRLGPVEEPPVVPEEVTPVGAGITRLVATTAEWDAAVSAATPGDVIRLTATINARLVYRGTNGGGGGTGDHGTAEAPIVITADPGVWIDPGNQNSGFGALDILYANHVHAVGVNVRNAQFGIRCMQCHGTAASPVRFASSTVTQIGHAGIHYAGHWSTHSPSTYGLIENNVITYTGMSAPNYGEGIYIGHGGTEWIDETSNVTVRGNDISYTGAEGVDIKPGTRNILVEGNYIHDLAPIDGGAISAHYVSAAANPDPNELDPVTVRGNWIWNQNLNGTGGSNDWAIWVGHGGVDILDNVIWGLRDDYNRAKGVRIRATQVFGPHPIRIEGNVFWSRRGWVAELTPSGASNVVASGNWGVDPSSSEILVSAGDFVGPVPAFGASGTADSGSGPGSGLLLTSATTTTTAPTTTTTAPTTTTTTAPTTTTTAPTTTTTAPTTTTTAPTTTTTAPTTTTTAPPTTTTTAPTTTTTAPTTTTTAAPTTTTAAPTTTTTAAPTTTTTAPTTTTTAAAPTTSTTALSGGIIQWIPTTTVFSELAPGPGTGNQDQPASSATSAAPGAAGDTGSASAAASGAGAGGTGGDLRFDPPPVTTGDPGGSEEQAAGLVRADPMAAIREVLGRQTVATQEPGADGAAEQDPDEGDAAPTTTGLAPAETGAGAAESAGEEAATDDAGGDGRSAPGFVYAVVAAAVLVAGAGVFRAVRMRAGG